MMRLLKLSSILSFLFIGTSFPNYEYKTDTGYIIQELGINTSHDHFKLFTGFNAILSLNNEYYNISEDRLKQSIKEDRINLKELIMIIEPDPTIYMLSDSNIYKPLLLNYSNGIENLLNLDETGVYEIGEKYYIFRKVKYKYIDGIKLKYLDPEEGVLREFESENIRLFLYTQELLPIPKSIQKHVWKRRYEFPDFWHDYVKNHLNIVTPVNNTN